jgi:hypothetical protein
MQSWSVTATASVAHFSAAAATLDASAGAAILGASAGAPALSASDAPVTGVAFVEAGTVIFATGAATAGSGADASHAADVMAQFEPHVAAGDADG